MYDKDVGGMQFERFCAASTVRYLVVKGTGPTGYVIFHCNNQDKLQICSVNTLGKTQHIVHLIHFQHVCKFFLWVSGVRLLI